MIDRSDETLEMLFSGHMMKYTLVFNQTKRSNYDEGSDAFNNFLEYEGQLCYIFTGTACFRKCSENIYKRDFSYDYKEFISSSDSCKKIMTLAKIQPFCMKHGVDIGAHNMNSERILHRKRKQKNICLYLYSNHFCELWKVISRTSLLDAIVEIENNFRYEKTQINDNIIKQVIEYKFPISLEKNCLHNVFVFDLETCNVKYSEYCESCGAGVYHPNDLY